MRSALISAAAIGGAFIALLFFVCVGWAFFSWLAEQLT